MPVPFQGLLKVIDVYLANSIRIKFVRAINALEIAKGGLILVVGVSLQFVTLCVVKFVSIC